MDGCPPSFPVCQRSLIFAKQRKARCIFVGADDPVGHGNAANSHKIPIKSVHSAGGQGRPPLRDIQRQRVGGEAHIAPAECTRLYGNLQQIRNVSWADAGISPYGMVGSNVEE